MKRSAAREDKRSASRGAGSRGADPTAASSSLRSSIAALGYSLVKFIGFALLLFATLAFILFYKRSMYRIGPDRYITVWSTIGARSFIIPGRYFWPIYPSRSHIRTSTDSDASGLVWTEAGDTIFYEDTYPSFSIYNSASTSMPVIMRWDTDEERLDSVYTMDGHFREDVDYLTLSLDFGMALYREETPASAEVR
jgi:hypothetical protein